MKTSINIIATLVICSLCLTSCGKDSLTKSISLDDSNQIKNEEIKSRSPGDQFEFNEMVFLTTHDAFNEGDVSGSLQRVSIEGERETLVRSPSNLTISGFGDSHILNWGSWYVDVDLDFHQLKNRISGTLKFTFPDMGDEVEFRVSGQPALVTNPNDNSQEFDMHLTVARGTGRFQSKTFEGSAVLLDVGSLFEQVKDISTYLVVDGTMLDK